MSPNRRPLSRRAFLQGAAASATAAALWTPDMWNPARSRALRTIMATAANPAGTTLESTIVLQTGAGYARLKEGPGWPTIERSELAALRPDRDAKRVALASIVHLTDVHTIDAQSPGRVEFLDRYGDPFTGAFRPQETLTTQVQASMVQRVNQVARGPVTGRPLDCAVSTGDNVDNQQTNELEWFMGVLNGGTVTANSGKPAEYEGVQSIAWGDPNFWHPDPGLANGDYDTKGLPRIPGLLEAAIKPYQSSGLNIAWYSCYGNHDGLIQGNLPTSEAADAIFTGNKKITDLPAGMPPLKFVGDMFASISAVKAAAESGAYPSRAVTPDVNRRTVKTKEWVQAHLDRPGKVGPKGHGYTESHLGAPALYYSFEISPGVLGISLDTGGYNSGSIGQIQMDWLNAELAKAHSKAFDAAGNPTKPGGTDQVVVLFSHFTIGTLKGALPDPQRPNEKRYKADEFVAFLRQWPNIVGWINGHTHTNEIQPVSDPSGRTNGFWEITTASHVDYPEHARIIEIVDNRDGTISLLCTMLEHAAPAATNPDDKSLLGLAAISRELSANDVGVNITARLGPVEALNVELALKAPFDLQKAGVTGSPGTTVAGNRRPGGDGAGANTPAGASSPDGTSGVSPIAIGGAAVAAVALAAGATVALRQRGTSSPVPAAAPTGDSSPPDAN